ncbi:MAG: hypothetical protein WBC97_04540 [Gemmatimonadales bacterium]
MRAGFAVRLGALDDAIAGVVGQVAVIGPGALQPDASGRWGPLAIVEHLVLVHEGSAAVLKGTGPVLPGGRRSSWWRPFLMSAVLHSRIRVRAPTARVLPSADPVPLPVLTKRWQEAQGQLWQAVSHKGDLWGDGLVFRHPLAGWLDVAGTLQFLIDHIGHHEGRLTEILITE